MSLHIRMTLPTNFVQQLSGIMFFSKAFAPVSHREGMDPGTIFTKKKHSGRGDLLQNRNVSGFVGVFQKNVRFFATAEEATDEQGKPVISANLGNSLKKEDITPVTLPCKDTLADVMARFAPREGGTSFDIKVGPEVSESATDPEDSSITMVNKVYFGKMSKVLVVPHGVDVLEGPVANNAVQMALLKLPLGNYFVEAITGNREGISDIPSEDLPPTIAREVIVEDFDLDVSVLPPPADINDTTSLYAQVHQRAAAVRASAQNLQSAQQGGMANDGSEGASRDHSPTVRIDDNPSHVHYHYSGAPPQEGDGADDATMRTVQARSVFDNMQVFLKIIGARFGKIPSDAGVAPFEVALGTLSSEVTDIFTKCPSSQWGELFRSGLESHIEEIKEAQSDYIYQVVDYPHWGDYVVKLLSRNKWKSTGTDVDIDVIDQTLSALMFCPPPDQDDVDSGYTQYVQGTRQNETEEALGETASNRAKKVAKIFTNGRLASVDDLISTFANIIVFFSWVFDFDSSNFQEEAPHLAISAMELANLLKASDSRHWGRRCAKAAPSGLLKILEQFQSEWRLMVRVANTTSVRSVVRTGSGDIPFAKFEGVVRRHDKILNELSNAISDGGLNSYKDPTPLWLFRHKKRPATTPAASAGPKRQATEKGYPSSSPTPQQHVGWLQINSPGYKVTWPPGMQTPICLYFARNDQSCAYGNACNQAHVTLKALQQWERDLVVNMVESDPNLEIVDSARRPGNRPYQQNGGRGGAGGRGGGVSSRGTGRRPRWRSRCWSMEPHLQSEQ